jgi:hypothetical protein
MHGNQISETLSAMIQRLPRLAKVGYVHPGSERDAREDMVVVNAKISPRFPVRVVHEV